MTRTSCSYEDAERTVLATALRLGSEMVGLEHASGRVLADDVLAGEDVPAFDRAAMDGFACRCEDADAELDVIATVPTGTQSQHAVGPGQCVRIMTGARLPAGAETVVMLERSEPRQGGRVCLRGERQVANVRLRGEDVRQGQVVLGAGTLLGPAQIGVLAGLGHTKPSVVRRARVGIVATGSELVDPDGEPGAAQIRNSNGPQLCVQVQQVGAVARDYGITPDDEGGLEVVAARALADNDLVIFSGGVSVGDHDYVPKVLARLGVEVLVHGVDMQPGKPTLFGRRRQTLCFGLPGNPVAAFVVFELLLRPLLLRMMGVTAEPRLTPAILAADFARKQSDRQVTVPVRFDGSDGVRPIEYHGSAHLVSLCHADALLTVPAGVATLPAGSKVHVRPL